MPATPPPGRIAARLPALAYPTFRLFLAGAVFGSIGWFMQGTAPGAVQPLADPRASACRCRDRRRRPRPRVLGEVSGAVAEHTSATLALVAGSGATLVITLVVAALVPTVRSLEGGSGSAASTTPARPARPAGAA